jgi:hypothetical protein
VPQNGFAAEEGSVVVNYFFAPKLLIASRERILEERTLHIRTPMPLTVPALMKFLPSKNMGEANRHKPLILC